MASGNSFDLLNSSDKGSAATKQPAHEASPPASKSSRRRRNRRAKEKAEKSADTHDGIDSTGSFTPVGGKGKGKQQQYGAVADAAVNGVREINLGGQAARTRPGDDDSFQTVQRGGDRARGTPTMNGHSSHAAPHRAPGGRESTGQAKAAGEQVRAAQALAEKVLTSGGATRDRAAAEFVAHIAASMGEDLSSADLAHGCASAVAGALKALSTFAAAVPSIRASIHSHASDLVAALGTGSAAADQAQASRPRGSKDALEEKFSRALKLACETTGPKLSERARITADWHGIAGACLGGLLGATRRDPIRPSLGVLSQLRAACAQEQDALMRVDAKGGAPVPPEVASLDDDIAALEQQIAQLRLKRAKALDKHHSALGQAQKKVVMAFDGGVEAIKTLERVLNDAASAMAARSGPARVKATPKHANALRDFVWSAACLVACKAAQQRELSTRVEFYVQQISDLKKDGMDDSDSLVTKLRTMLGNVARDGAGHCATATTLLEGIAEYARRLDVDSLALPPALLTSLSEDASQVAALHAQNVAALEARGEGVGLGVAAGGGNVGAALAGAMEALTGVAFTGAELPAAVFPAAPSPKALAAKSKPEGRANGHGHSTVVGSKEKKEVVLSPIPKVSAWQGNALFQNR